MGHILCPYDVQYHDLRTKPWGTFTLKLFNAWEALVEEYGVEDHQGVESLSSTINGGSPDPDECFSSFARNAERVSPLIPSKQVAVFCPHISRI